LHTVLLFAPLGNSGSQMIKHWNHHGYETITRCVKIVNKERAHQGNEVSGTVVACPIYPAFGDDNIDRHIIVIDRNTLDHLPFIA